MSIDRLPLNTLFNYVPTYMFDDADEALRGLGYREGFSIWRDVDEQDFCFLS